MKLFIVLLLTFSASAKTLLVSDIDDTLKIAHIRSTIGKVANAFRTNNVFLGMNDLISAVKQDADAEVFYLTNAPEKLMGASHRALLRNGKFPQGTLLLRPSGVSSDEHKVNSLERLITEHRPDSIILFGDNGEKDIKFYHHIAMRYPGIKFVTFIRIAYSQDADHSPMRGQYGFISPMEIAAKLYNEGFLDLSSADRIFDKHAPAFVADKQRKKKGMTYLPKWLTCRGHMSFKTLQAFAHPWKSSVSSKIQAVCAK